MYSGALTITVITEACLPIVSVKTNPSSTNSSIRTTYLPKLRSKLRKTVSKKAFCPALMSMDRPVGIVLIVRPASHVIAMTGLLASHLMGIRMAKDVAVLIMRRSILVIHPLLEATLFLERSKSQSMCRITPSCLSSGIPSRRLRFT